MAPMTIQERLRMYYSINIKPFYLEIADHIDVLEARIKELEQDAARIDFIASRARCDPKMDGKHVWWPTSFNHALKGNTLREAVDAAMKDQS